MKTYFFNFFFLLAIEKKILARTKLYCALYISACISSGCFLDKKKDIKHMTLIQKENENEKIVRHKQHIKQDKLINQVFTTDIPNRCNQYDQGKIYSESQKNKNISFTNSKEKFNETNKNTFTKKDKFLSSDPKISENLHTKSINKEINNSKTCKNTVRNIAAYEHNDKVVLKTREINAVTYPQKATSLVPSEYFLNNITKENILQQHESPETIRTNVKKKVSELITLRKKFNLLWKENKTNPLLLKKVSVENNKRQKELIKEMIKSRNNFLKTIKNDLKKIDTMDKINKVKWLKGKLDLASKHILFLYQHIKWIEESKSI